MEPRGPGYIQIVSVTADPERTIAKVARNSYGRYSRETTYDQDCCLLRFLYQNKHTSPFEFVDISFQICAPMSILTHFIRHRTGSFNVMSHRYSEADEVFKGTDQQLWYSPVKTADDIRMQSTLNRQSSVKDTTLDEGEKQEVVDRFSNINDLTGKMFDQYHHLNKMGVAREITRFSLPCSTYDLAMCKFDLHNLLHLLRLRTHDHSQLETREYAFELVRQLREHVPFIMKLFDEEMEAVTFNAQEIRIIKGLEPDNPRQQAIIESKMAKLGLTKQ